MKVIPESNTPDSSCAPEVTNFEIVTKMKRILYTECTRRSRNNIKAEDLHSSPIELLWRRVVAENGGAARIRMSFFVFRKVIRSHELLCAL